MSDIMSKELREALDNPRIRYRIVDAVLARAARETQAGSSKTGTGMVSKDSKKASAKGAKKK